MSANNWRVCPKCSIDAKEKRRLAIAAASQLYGKVPREEYEVAVSQASSLPSVPDETLREDWEIRTSSNGVFSVNYSCSCQHCGFEFSFAEHRNTLEGK